MPNAPTTNSRLGTLDRLHNSREVDLKTKTEGTESEFGETISSTSTQTVTALVPPPSVQHDPSFFGMADTDIDIEFQIDGDVSVTDGGGILATEIDADQDGTFEYVVETAVAMQNGIQALACTNRKD